MAINPLSMQQSVPRAPDVSNLQQQAIQKPTFDQNVLAQQTIKENVQNRTQTQKTNETEKGIIRDQNSSKQHQQQKQKKDEQEKNFEEKTIHPYKGHSIDIKL